MGPRGVTKRAAQPAARASLDDVKQTLRRLIEKNAGIPGVEVDDASSVDGDLAMDSMSFLALQVDVEETFGINCTPDDILAANRFAAIAALVQQRAMGAGASRTPVAPSRRPAPVAKRSVRGTAAPARKRR